MKKADKTAAVKALKKAAEECVKALDKLDGTEGRAKNMTTAALARIGVALTELDYVDEDEPEEAELVADEAETSGAD